MGRPGALRTRRGWRVHGQDASAVGERGVLFSIKKSALALLYRGLAEGQFFVFHRRGSINHAWFSPGLMSVLHMCERTSLVEGFLG